MHLKTTISIIILLLTSTLYAVAENPNVGNPFKSRNAPAHSGQRQRFITRGDTDGRIGNDIVTGNVGGGKHFRGVVPYGSSYYTSTSGATSVNHFVRRSADPLVNDRNPGQTPTYYDPRRSVSSFRRPDGSSGLSNPQLTGQGRTNPSLRPNAERNVVTRQQERPLSVNNMDLEQILTRREKLREEAQKESKLTQKDAVKEKGFFDDPLTPDQLKQERQDERKQPAVETSPASEDTKSTELPTEDQATNEKQTPEPTTDSEKQQDSPSRDYASPKSDLIPKPDLETIDPTAGRKALGQHATFESLAAEKFAGFMDAAEAFIKEGKYYKAADTYSLATVWKPKDARGYLGQSFSLFAAGEYMSSAYYLSRAFELDSTAALKTYNLAELIEDRDVFENRIVELTTWQDRSNSGELALLLAYISYQDGKATRAVDQIRKAKAAMPNDRTVALLKNIIDPEDVLK